MTRSAEAFALEVQCDDLTERSLLFKEWVILCALVVIAVTRQLAT